MAAKHQGQARTSEARRPADRASRFIARVDAHLPTLANDGDRRAFLDRQLDGWEHRYATSRVGPDITISRSVRPIRFAHQAWYGGHCATGSQHQILVLEAEHHAAPAARRIHLTRVTRIFQKRLFFKNTARSPLRPRRRPWGG